MAFKATQVFLTKQGDSRDEQEFVLVSYGFAMYRIEIS
jgi:hypothetical protein